MGTYQRPLVIINPHSAGQRTGKRTESIVQLIAAHLGTAEVRETERPGHAIVLAQTEGPRFDLVLAVGGDGTLHEVANGLLNARETGAKVPPVGYLPCGTGGDFRKTLETPLQWGSALAAITAGHRATIDVGRIRFGAGSAIANRYFINVAGFGMGGLVDRQVAKWNRRLSGKSAYFVASTLALFRARRAKVRCRIERGDEVREEVLHSWNIAICNGKYFGGGMMVAPMARPNDGQFEVVSFGFPSKFGIMGLGMWIYDGKHIGRPDIQHFPCTAIELELVEPHLSHVFCPDIDGEPIGSLPVRVDVVSNALTIAGAQLPSVR